MRKGGAQGEVFVRVTSAFENGEYDLEMRGVMLRPILNT